MEEKIKNLKKQLKNKDTKFENVIYKFDDFITNMDKIKLSIKKIIKNTHIENLEPITENKQSNSNLYNSNYKNFSFKPDNNFPNEEIKMEKWFTISEKNESVVKNYDFKIISKDILNLLNNIFIEKKITNNHFNEYRVLNKNYEILVTNELEQSNKNNEVSKSQNKELNDILIRQRKKLNEKNKEIEQLNQIIINNESDFLEKDDIIESLQKNIKIISSKVNKSINNFDDTLISEKFNQLKEVEEKNKQLIVQISKLHEQIEANKRSDDEEIKIQKDILMNKNNELHEEIINLRKISNISNKKKI